jgi:7-keto-8-aminopelargonate synthetase-like enzyme
MNDSLQFVLDEMAALETQGLKIRLRTMGSPADAWMVVDGQRVLNFCTNNYLGLANHPRMKAAAKAAIDLWSDLPRCAPSPAPRSFIWPWSSGSPPSRASRTRSTSNQASAPTRRPSGH